MWDKLQILSLVNCISLDRPTFVNDESALVIMQFWYLIFDCPLSNPTINQPSVVSSHHSVKMKFPKIILHDNLINYFENIYRWPNRDYQVFFVNFILWMNDWIQHNLQDLNLRWVLDRFATLHWSSEITKLVFWEPFQLLAVNVEKSRLLENSIIGFMYMCMDQPWCPLSS